MDFDAILASVVSADEHERERLRTIAQESDLAHDAYALGVQYLRTERYASAARWLRVAERHGLVDVLPLLRHCELLETEDVDEAVTEPAVAAGGSSAKAGVSPLGATASQAASAPGASAHTTATIVASTDETTTRSVREVVFPAATEGLTGGASEPGTIFVLALAGGFVVGPEEDRSVVFGRNRSKVHVCVGEDDPQVSREHGSLVHRDGQWWVHNTGRVPVRIDQRLLFPFEEPLPLTTGYTQMFIHTRLRQHLVEVFVTGPDGERPVARHTEPTAQPRTWPLTETERLVLAVLFRRYLESEDHPQPLSKREAAQNLQDLQPEVGWTARRVEHVVTRVRSRLSEAGVPGLTRGEVGEPVGNAVSHNLIQELLLTTTLIPKDLELIDAR